MEQEFGVTKRYVMSIHEYNIHVEPSTDSTCGAKNEDEKQNEAPRELSFCAILLTSASFAVLIMSIDMYKGC